VALPINNPMNNDRLSQPRPIPKVYEEELPSTPELSQPTAPPVVPVFQEKVEVEEVFNEPISDENWEIDSRTGKKYKKLKGASKEAIRAGRNGGLTLDQMFSYIEEDESFDVDDLNSAASLFLPHLRVPPSKEEILRLRQERAERMQKQDKEYEEKNSLEINDTNN